MRKLMIAVAMIGMAACNRVDKDPDVERTKEYLSFKEEQKVLETKMQKWADKQRAECAETLNKGKLKKDQQTYDLVPIQLIDKTTLIVCQAHVDTPAAPATPDTKKDQQNRVERNQQKDREK